MRRYFRQLAEVAQARLFEAKLLIVGEAEAGKTSLARKLQDSAALLPTPDETTEGIDVHTWEFPLPPDQTGFENLSGLNEQPFRVNIWDFGGQEIYHATHQFFLTHRSLYILVADARAQKTDFDYWLHAVKTLSGGSPLLIVVNEKEGRTWHIDSGRLSKQFGNLAATLSVNLNWKRTGSRISPCNTISTFVRSIRSRGWGINYRSATICTISASAFTFRMMIFSSAPLSLIRNGGRMRSTGC
ncbi:MAG: hypothetical protein GY805_14885 [Chloroflexi bacterium]|nr:hypothetical protein [Chloroflexota bacterium]